MHARDQQIDWRRKRVFLEPLQGMGWTTGGTVPVGLHTGDPVFAEISTYGFGAVKFEGVGDMWVQTWQLPYDLDTEHPVYVSVLWTTESTTTGDTAEFIVLYQRLAVGSALATAATALDTTIKAANGNLADEYGTSTALTITKTEAGKIDGGTFTDGDFVVFNTEINATDVTIASEFIYLLGLEIVYTPKMCTGIGKTYEAPLS